MDSRTDLGKESSEERFADGLAQLKRQGASVLVVGSVRAAQRQSICRRLLGQATARARRRVLVSTTGESDDISDLLETDPETDTSLTCVRYATQARSAAASSAHTSSMEPDAPSIDGSPMTTTTLSELGIAIASAIDSFEAESDGLEPAELRVGVDSLVPLLEAYDTERVFKFLHLTNGWVRDSDGMVHYHLPMDRDSDVVTVLAPLFDIIIELRDRDGVAQERWSIDDGDLRSGWVSATQP